MNSYNIVRKAVLIGAQTPKGNHLPGIPADLQRMSSFYTSPNGGSWRRNEITTLYNKPWREVLSTIQRSVADYSIIYCSAHGYTNTNGELMICLADGDIPAGALLNNSVRQLMIVDACRTMERGAAIGAIPWPQEQWLYATGYSFARELYDQYITESGFGKLMIYATNHDNYAYENSQHNGGEFTLSLLDSVMDFQQSGQQGPLFIEEVVDYSSYLLEQKQVKQIPSYVYREGYFKAPFGIVSPTFVPVQHKRNIPVKPKQTQGIEPLLFGAGLILTAYALSKL